MYEDTSFQKSIRISKLVFKDSSDFGMCSVFDMIYSGIGFYFTKTKR